MYEKGRLNDNEVYNMRLADVNKKLFRLEEHLAYLQDKKHELTTALGYTEREREKLELKYNQKIKRCGDEINELRVTENTK